MRRVVWLVLVLACGSDDKGETDTSTAAPTESDTDTDTDADTDTDTDADTDTDTTGVATITRYGAGTVAPDFVGTESIEVVADDGNGDLLCHVTLDLTTAATRDDCGPCMWAFDLAIGNTTVVVDEAGTCMATLGIDAASAASWDGTVRTYGYDDDYVGHSQMVMFHDGKDWVPGSFGVWDDGARTIAYEWFEGFFPLK